MLHSCATARTILQKVKRLAAAHFADDVLQPELRRAIDGKHSLAVGHEGADGVDAAAVGEARVEARVLSSRIRSTDFAMFVAAALMAGSLTNFAATSSSLPRRSM